MNLREVREAAELYKTGEGKSHERFMAFEMMSNYILATIDPEPDLPITAEWLREEWGFENLRVDSRVTRLCVDVGETMVRMGSQFGVWNCYGDDFEWPHKLTTRQQFCDLARCLGIPRRKDGAK